MLPRTNVIETEIGRFVLFPTSDGVSSILYKHGHWEPLTALLATNLAAAFGRGRTVIDAGANVGAFTVPVARSLAASHRVFSFEVQRIVFYQLCAAVILNRLDNVHAKNIGLSDAPARLEVPVPDYNSDSNIGAVSIDPEVRRTRGATRHAAHTDGANVRTEPMDVVPLDSFDLDDVSVLKIDVEGMEHTVLRGARRTLERSGFPPILFEIWNTALLPEFTTSQEALLSYLRDLGYELQTFGELGVAQHRTQQLKLTVVHTADGYVQVQPLAA